MSKRKKISMIIFLVAAMVIFLYPYFITIGHMAGAENEMVVLENGSGEGVYVLCEHDHKPLERGRILGRIEGLYDFAFDLDNDEYPDCIYVAGMGRGDYYTLRKNIPD